MYVVSHTGKKNIHKLKLIIEISAIFQELARDSNLKILLLLKVLVQKVFILMTLWNLDSQNTCRQKSFLVSERWKFIFMA